MTSQAAVAGSRLTLEEIELFLLFEGIYRHYGLDFRHYSAGSIARRVRQFMAAEGVETVSDAQARVLHDSGALARFIAAVSIPTTAMFRDPSFYRAFREQVVPALQALPCLRVWHAGCATGEEVYSMAILLREAGLLDRARIYATDINETAIRRAKQATFPSRKLAEYERNYGAAGGGGSLADYCVVRGDSVRLDDELGKGIVWAAHNLATDGSFNEFQVVLCRNVMIYFAPELQKRVHRLLHESLAPKGFLALGARESLDLTGFERRYARVHETAKIYRRLS